MILSLIVAADERNVIGKDGALPWNLPKDLQRFRTLTKGKPVIMGRKTYDSLPEGRKPLLGRTNIVITRNPDLQCPGCLIAGSVQTAVDEAKDTGAKEAFVIGGGEIYRRALPMVDRIYLTRIHGEFEGDITFPELNADDWVEVEREENEADSEHPYAYTFMMYQRK